MDVLTYKNSITHTIVKGFNTSIKTFADGSKKIKHTKYNRFKGFSRKKSGGVCSDNVKEHLTYNNMYRSKSNLIDLVYHNSMIDPWQYFVTLTFDPKEVDSLDYEIVSEALAKWLDNMKHQNPNMAYVIVPELHKSGRIHFHGLFRDVPNWDLVPARSERTGNLIKKNGVQIYNLVNYKYGFTTVSEIKNQEAVSVYMSKYMTKELINLNYKKRYWSSRNLKRPTVQYALWDDETLEFHIDKCKVQYENKNAIFLNQEVNIIDNDMGTSDIESHSLTGPLI